MTGQWPLYELGYDAKSPLRFSILVNNGDATLADIATLIKNQLAKIGAEAKINLVDTTAAVECVLVKHDFEMNVSTLRPSRPDLFALVTITRQASGIYPYAGGTRPAMCALGFLLLVVLAGPHREKPHLSS